MSSRMEKPALILIAAGTAGGILANTGRVHAENDIPVSIEGGVTDQAQQPELTEESAQTSDQTISPEVHAIQPDDTLSSIARRWDTTLEKVLSANPSITDPNSVPIGFEVVKPSVGLETTESAASTITEPAHFQLPGLTINPVIQNLSADEEPMVETDSSFVSGLNTGDAEDYQNIEVPENYAVVNGKTYESKKANVSSDVLNRAQSVASQVIAVVNETVDAVAEETGNAANEIRNNISNSDDSVVELPLPDGQTLKLSSATKAEINYGVDGSINIRINSPTAANITDPPAETISTPSVSESPATETPPPVAEEQQPASSYEEYLVSRNYPEMPANLATIKSETDKLSNMGEIIAERTPYDREYNDWLFNSFTPTKEGYDAFVASGIDMSKVGIWGDKPPLDKHKQINPIGTVVHWMAGTPDTVDDFARQMKHDVQFTMFPGGKLYQLTNQPNDLTWHASGGNDRIGVEVWGKNHMDWDPAMAETLVYWEVYMHNVFGIEMSRDVNAIMGTPLDRYGDYTPSVDMIGSVTGHGEIDANLGDQSVGKIDPPSSTMNSLYLKAQQLKALLNGEEMQSFIPEDEPASEPGTGEEAPIIDDTKKPVIVDGYLGDIVEDPNMTQQASSEQLSDKFDYLLSPEALNYKVRSVDEAIAKSLTSAQNGGELSNEEAYGSAILPSDSYAYLRDSGATHIEAVMLTAVGMRETGLRPGAVGDLLIDDGSMPSFGPYQIRDMNEQDTRLDPSANLDPRKAALNTVQLYLQLGMKPWSVVMPGKLTENSIYEAIRLPNREMPDNKREAVNKRARKIAEQVMAMADDVQSRIDSNQGVGV